MHHIGTIFLLFLALPALAANAKKTNINSEKHKINSAIAQMLQANAAQNIKKITTALKSNKDRVMFEKIYVQKKGQKIRFFPFMDQLIIQEGKVTHAIQLINISPLKIRLNGGPVVEVNAENILKSFEKKPAKTAFDMFIPKAHAWSLNLLGSEPGEEWGFLYASAMSGNLSGISKNTFGSDMDEGVFKKEIASFLEKFDVQKLNCNQNSLQAKNGIDPVYGASFSDSDGERYTFSCQWSEGKNAMMDEWDRAGLCNVSYVHEGDVTLAQASADRLFAHMKTDLQKLAREVGDSPDLNIDDFGLNCVAANDCSLKWKAGIYTQKTKYALTSNGNILPRQFRNQYAAHLEEYTRLTQKIQKTQTGGYNQAVVIKALTACCRDKLCSEQTRQNTDLILTDEKPRVSQ